MPENEIIRKGDKITVILNSDLIASAAIEMRNQFKNILVDGVSNVTVDLSSVNIVDSQGIGLLVALYNTLTKNRGVLSVINASAEILELFKSMRLDRHFSISGQLPAGESYE
jgi:anti-anti-sigma factor